MNDNLKLYTTATGDAHKDSIQFGYLTLEEAVKTLLGASQELYEIQEEEALEYLINQSLLDVKERNTLTLDELIDSI